MHHQNIETQLGMHHHLPIPQRVMCPDIERSDHCRDGESATQITNLPNKNRNHPDWRHLDFTLCNHDDRFPADSLKVMYADTSDDAFATINPVGLFSVVPSAEPSLF